MHQDDVDWILVHCSATPAHMDIGAKRIIEWHTRPKPDGNGWRRGGYHEVIRRNGNIEMINSFKVPGIHAAGYNNRSIAICLIGGSEDGDDAPGWQGKPTFNFADNQINTLVDTLHYLEHKYPFAKVAGHRDLDRSKACPSFDVRTWWSRGGNIRGARAYGV